ncbi:MAG: dipeptide ABC transporter ATP-binding protein [Pseudomonadota bacterium]|nr:dipeptide ABC transporter ATP-binding protein [Pseudomonadota bacterium]
MSADPRPASPPASPGEPLLRVEGLTKHFPVLRGFLRRHVGTVRAVDDVSFTLGRKKTLAVVGESGCGKTTAGRALLRLVEPDKGQVWFRGKDLPTLGAVELQQMRRHMQIIFQDPFSSLNPRHTIGQIVGRPLVLHGVAASMSEAEDRVRDLLARVGLQPKYISRYPHEFSGGQRQRIGIARAIALHPEFVVCDEAVSALDVSVRAQVLNLLMDLQEEFGLSYVFVTHDLSVVRHIADDVVVMYLGQIVERAPRDSLFARPSHPYTQALLSAAPEPDPAKRRKRIVLSGDVPSPMNPPSGCRFHTRCPLAFARCSVDTPAQHGVADGHTVACHLYEGRTEPIDLASAARAAG